MTYYPHEECPAEKFVVGVIRPLPEGGEYLAVIDDQGKIQTAEEATLLLLELRLYTTLHLALGYRLAGRWVCEGDPPAARNLSETSPDRLRFGPVLLKRRTSSKPPDSISN
jgi:hypothetical protein